jgi:anti-sigma B factor antagonist
MGAVMDIKERIIDDVVVLSIVGDITMSDSGAPLLAANIKGALQAGYTRLVLDLGGVRYVDSGGLGEIVHAYTSVTNGGGTIKLLNLTRRLKDLMAVTKLLTVFDSFDQESEALASFTTAAAR